MRMVTEPLSLILYILFGQFWTTPLRFGSGCQMDLVLTKHGIKYIICRLQVACTYLIQAPQSPVSLGADNAFSADCNAP